MDAKDNMNAVPDPTALTAAPEKKGKKSNLTPLEQQYVAIKKEYPFKFCKFFSFFFFLYYHFW